MNSRLPIFVLFLLLTARLLPAQLPPPQKLSEEDRRGFQGELKRLRALLQTANDEGAQFRLSTDGRNIIGTRMIERRNPLFDGITTGALVNGELYYIANPQIGKKSHAKLNALLILAVKILL